MCPEKVHLCVQEDCLHICVVDADLGMCSGQVDYCSFQWEQPSLAVVVYDVTEETSFSSCVKWLERVRVLRPYATIPGQCRLTAL